MLAGLEIVVLCTIALGVGLAGGAVRLRHWLQRRQMRAVMDRTGLMDSGVLAEALARSMHLKDTSKARWRFLHRPGRVVRDGH